VLGPLGKGFDLAGITRRALLIAGGIGIVPLVALAESAIRNGVVVTLAAGFRSADRVFPASLLSPEVEYLVATDDGTRGFSGFVTELARPLVPWADQIFACGPTPMLKATARLGARREMVQLSLEERMACGMGVCLGCVVPTRHGLRRVCRDGPVFRLSDLDW
jgi:dihydroorotate dehydrogenase electron transfer subunit